MKLIMMLSVLFTFHSFANVQVEAVAGKCDKQIRSAARKYLGPNNADFKFQDFSDEASFYAPNKLTLSYNYSGVCQGEVNMDIVPTKTAVLNGVLTATECTASNFSEGAGDCE